MKTKEKVKVKAKTGSLTIDDYEAMLPLVLKKQKEYKQFSAVWSKWGVIADKIIKKVSSMHKQEITRKSGPSTITKEKARWWCFVCEKEHDTITRKLVCPDCGSEDVVTMDKYLAEKGRKQEEDGITI